MRLGSTLPRTFSIPATTGSLGPDRHEFLQGKLRLKIHHLMARFPFDHSRRSAPSHRKNDLSCSHAKSFRRGERACRFQ